MGPHPQLSGSLLPRGVRLLCAAGMVLLALPPPLIPLGKAGSDHARTPHHSAARPPHP